MTTSSSSAQTGNAATYQIDPAHTSVEFSVKHMMFSTIKGKFTDLAGEIVFDEGNPAASSVNATINVTSVSTGDTNRDNHLRSADFFDVEKYPTISFTSKSVEPLGRDATYRIVGDLTMHGVTREIVLEAAHLGTGKDPWGGTRVGVTATTTIDRKDWGLNWNAALEAGGVLVSDQVKITLDFEAVKKS